MDDLALAPDGVLLGGTRKPEANGDPAAAEVWSLRTYKLVTHVEGLAGFLPAKVLGFAEGNHVLVLHQNSRQEGFVRVHEVGTGRQTAEFSAGGGQIFRLSPAGTYLAMGSSDQFQFFRCGTGARCGSILATEWEHNGLKMLKTTLAGAMFSPNGREFVVLYVGSGAARITAYDMGSGALTIDFSFADPERRGNGVIDYIPDGSGWLVFGDTVVSRTGKAPIYTFPKVDNVSYAKMATPEQLLQVVKTGSRLVFQTMNIPKDEPPGP